MNVDFQEQTVHYLRQTAPEALYREEVSEHQLPESVPEIEQIVSCAGALFVKRKEQSGGKVTVSGVIKACVLYRSADDGDLHKAEKEIDFSVQKELPAEESEQTVFYRGWIKRIDAKLLGSRKLLIRVNIGSSFRIFSAASVSVSTPSDPPKALQLMKNTYDMRLPSFIGETEFRINEESTLPETAAGVSNILNSSVSYRVSESKTVGDKVIFKGDVLLHILYMTASGSLHCFDTELPFSQYVELDAEAESDDVRLYLQPMSAEIDTDGQEDSKRLLVSLSVMAQAVVYDKKQVSLIEDAYVTRGKLEAEWKDLSFPAALDSQSFSVSGELTTAASADRVIDAQVYADCPVLRREENRVRVVLPVFADVLFFDKDHKLQGREIRQEISCDTTVSADALCAASGDIFEQPVCLASYDTLTLRLTAQIRLDSAMGSSLRTLCGAQIDTQKEKSGLRPSLIAKRAGTESVWEIAKACGSTVEAICEANSLSGGVAQEGVILLIPMQ